MIDFNDGRWRDLEANYDAWWRGKLGRPILPCVFYGKEPTGPKPANELLSYANCHDLSITPRQIVDRYDYELSRFEFAADGYPIMHTLWFGPGIIAAFLGARLMNDQRTVWFQYEKEIELRDLHLEYDADNVWLNRILDIYTEGMRKWGGRMVMAYPGMSGVMDLLAIFRGTSNLLLDLYDCADEVERLTREMQALWLRYFSDISERLQGSIGYTDWSGIFSKTPKCILQSDFAYMISNEMFKHHVLPEISSTAAAMGGTFYHLDGIGQLAHLDDLLADENITGIQWVSGEGEAATRDWSEVYRKISDARKKLEVFYDLETCLDEILPVIKQPDDLVKLMFYYPVSRKPEIMRRLAGYGVRC